MLVRRSKADRRRWAGLAAVVTVVATGAACGDDEEPSSAPATTSTTAASTVASASSTTAATSAATTSTSGGVPTSPTPSSTAPPRREASALGFGQVAFKVVPPGGNPATTAERCALLAETEQQQARGLMGFRDLAGYDGMLFRFGSDTTGGFYMRNVPVALSIAWFAADGGFVSSTDMAPCPNQDGCPTYAPPEPYRLALEVLQGGLGPLGVAEGSVLAVGGACPS